MGKLGTAVVDTKIQFAANFMFQSPSVVENSNDIQETAHALKVLPLAPSFDSETGLRVLCENDDITPKEF